MLGTQQGGPFSESDLIEGENGSGECQREHRVRSWGVVGHYRYFVSEMRSHYSILSSIVA